MRKIKDIIIEPQKTQKPRALVFIAHGYGADANDLKPIAYHFQRYFPDMVYILPNAPEACPMSGGYQWFALKGNPITDYYHAAAAVAPLVSDYIDEKIKQFSPVNESYILIGFSQGAMLALYIALRHIRSPLAVLSYSGMLLAGDDDEKSLIKTNNTTRFLLVHGTHDEVIPVQAIEHATKFMQKNNMQHQAYKIPGLAHGIDENGLQYGLELFENIFGDKAF